jgi:AGZA family xanthine/uracil permease-like MFS transporter
MAPAWSSEPKALLNYLRSRFGFLPVAPAVGDIDCGINLFFQITGTIVAVVGGMQMVLASPWEDDEGVDLTQMDDFISNLIYGKILNGMCVTMMFGTFYYAFMAVRMMKSDGRDDHMCMPYGVNTAAAFAFVYNIMAVAARDAKENGMDWEEGINYAWKVTTVANLSAGFIAAMVGFAGPAIMKVAPKPALLIALAGVGLTHLGIAQLMKVFSAGHLGFVPLATAVLGYFVGVKFHPIPNAVMIMLAGSFMGWAFSQGWPEDKVDKDGGTWEAVKNAASVFSFYLPRPLDAQAFLEIPEVALQNISVILPVAFVGAINTLVSVYQAHEAGDPYNVKEVLVVDGIATMVSALFGSPFGTCVFCSHKPLKRAGGTIYYSFFNCASGSSRWWPRSFLRTPSRPSCCSLVSRSIRTRSATSNSNTSLQLSSD